jgi:hypothetical protein
MSTYDKASLVLIPSGTKEGVVFSQKPTNGDGDFTFTRASSATRVNSDGLIEKETQNLLLQSNTFDTWDGIASTLSGQSGYDGTNDAWLITKSGTFDSIRQVISNSGVATFSVYAKAGTYDYVLLHIEDSSGDCLANFDLSTGSLGTLTNGITSKIEDVGGGWYRCSATFNRNVTDVRIYPSESGGYTGTSGSIYIQDAQLNQGLVADSYLETTTTAVYGGITDNIPRLDYTDASCPSLKLEPQRTNLIDYSEYLGVWAATRCIMSDNDTTSPDGTINASKMTSNDYAESYIQRNATLSGSIVAYSFYAKKGDLDYVHSLVWDVSANGCRQWFNISSGTTGSSTTFGSGYSVDSASIENMGNGWYRCTTIVNCSSGANGFRVNISSADSSLNSPVNSYGYFWGIQAEDFSSYATSYIPTYGASVTRVGDGDISKVVSSSNLLGNTYSIFFNCDNINFGSSTNNFNYLSSSLGGSAMYVYGSTLGINTTTGDDYSTFLQGFTNPKGGKFLAVYDGTQVKIYKDGSLYKTISNPSTRWDNPSNYRLRQNASNSSINYKSFILFPTALTDEEAIALTTI